MQERSLSWSNPSLWRETIPEVTLTSLSGHFRFFSKSSEHHELMDSVQLLPNRLDVISEKSEIGYWQSDQAWEQARENECSSPKGA